MTGWRASRRWFASGLLLMLGCSEAPANPDGDVEVVARAPATASVPRISVHDAKRSIAAGALLVDVREPAELRESGSFEGAINLPMSEFAKRAESLPRDRPIILYCRSGRRSAMAGDILTGLGFTRVHNLGGFQAIADAGWPLER